MRDRKVTNNGLHMTWVPVKGRDGRVRMEARWSTTTGTTTHKRHPHAA